MLLRFYSLACPFSGLSPLSTILFTIFFSSSKIFLFSVYFYSLIYLLLIYFHLKSSPTWCVNLSFFPFVSLFLVLFVFIGQIPFFTNSSLFCWKKPEVTASCCLLLSLVSFSVSMGIVSYVWLIFLSVWFSSEWSVWVLLFSVFLSAPIL